TEAVAMLAAAVTKSGEVPAVQHIVDLVTDSSSAQWQRRALLEGLDAALPSAGGGRGGRGGGGGGGGGGPAGGRAPGGRSSVTPGRPVTLAAEPAGLTKLAAGSNEIAVLASSVANKFDWPGRPAPVVRAVPLTAEQQKRYTEGAEIYKNLCAGCHQPDGRGKEKLGANLVDSAYVTGPDATAMIRVLLGGKEGPIGLMPPLASSFSDEQVAAALTYIRREWGHTGAPVGPLEVGEVRGLTKDRKKPWTDQELQLPTGRGRRGGGH